MLFEGRDLFALSPDDEAVVAAGPAAHAHEAVGEDPAAEERSELALDEARHGALAGAGQEGLEPLRTTE